ncbi:unnamed protein product [Fraxinus pennsylvanica]|uniref:Uncharacterized protein n=1 Tax=Fraxinus pennsylvanica TaxID=56036 RepID=A0AAD1ZZ16_9LAMI|nr:unnamed protein product [Fraxinus pennsylvanica]
MASSSDQNPLLPGMKLLTSALIATIMTKLDIPSSHSHPRARPSAPAPPTSRVSPPPSTFLLLPLKLEPTNSLRQSLDPKHQHSLCCVYGLDTEAVEATGESAVPQKGSEVNLTLGGIDLNSSGRLVSICILLTDFSVFICASIWLPGHIPATVNFLNDSIVYQTDDHAQKYFLKVQKNGTNERAPPPRPKRKSAHPYPQKAPKKVVSQATGALQSSAR